MTGNVALCSRRRSIPVVIANSLLHAFFAVHNSNICMQHIIVTYDIYDGIDRVQLCSYMYQLRIWECSVDGSRAIDSHTLLVEANRVSTAQLMRLE